MKYWSRKPSPKINFPSNGCVTYRPNGPVYTATEHTHTTYPGKAPRLCLLSSFSPTADCKTRGILSRESLKHPRARHELPTTYARSSMRSRTWGLAGVRKQATRILEQACPAPAASVRAPHVMAQTDLPKAT